MEKRPRAVWLFMQGYHHSSLPPMVIWYGKGKSFRAMADDYTIGLYRGKGYVLDELFLDPVLWENLEYNQEKRTAAAKHPLKDSLRLSERSSPRWGTDLCGKVVQKSY